MLGGTHPIHILICDPDTDKSLALIRTFAELGQVDVKQVDDPQKFTLAAAHVMPDLVILGDNFAEVPTLHLVHQLRRAPLLSRIPIGIYARSESEQFWKEIMAEGVALTLSCPADRPSASEFLESYFRIEQSPKVLQLMQGAEFFKGFVREDLRYFINSSVARRYTAGETICRQGVRADCLYVLLEGEAEAIIANDLRGALVVPLTSGSCFGEVGVLDDELRSAWCLATSDCLVLEMGKTVFSETSNPAVGKLYKRLAELLARRLRHMRQVIDEQVDGQFKEKRTSIPMDGVLPPRESNTTVEHREVDEEELARRTSENILTSPLATPTAIALSIDESVEDEDEYEVLLRKIELRTEFIMNKINDTVADMLRKKLVGYWVGSKLAKHNPHRLWSPKLFLPKSTRLKNDIHIVVLCPEGEDLYRRSYFGLPFTHHVISLPKTGCTGTFLGTQEAIDRYLTARSLASALKGDLEMSIYREWCQQDAVEFLSHSLADVRPETLFVCIDKPDGAVTRQLREVYPEHQVVTVVQGIKFDPNNRRQGVFTVVEQELAKQGLLTTQEEYQNEGFYEGETFFLPDFSEYFSDTDALTKGGFLFGTVAVLASLGPDYSGRDWGSAGGSRGAVKAARARYGLKGAQSAQEMADAISWADQ